MVRPCPERLTPDALAARYPRLYHMAEEGSWPSIRKRGLLSTTALLDLFELRGEPRAAIDARRRDRSVAIHHPAHGTAWVRDNLPVNETVLRRTLVGMTEEQYYRTLNGRVFFWVSTRRLDKLRNAPPYKDRLHDICRARHGRAAAAIRRRGRAVASELRRGAPSGQLSTRDRHFSPDPQLPVGRTQGRQRGAARGGHGPLRGARCRGLRRVRHDPIEV